MPASHALRAAAEAAIAAGAAAADLDNAVGIARAEGNSWRTIAIATGIPHQPCTEELSGSDAQDDANW